MTLFLNFETGFVKVSLAFEAERFGRFDCKQGKKEINKLHFITFEMLEDSVESIYSIDIFHPR